MRVIVWLKSENSLKVDFKNFETCMKHPTDNADSVVML